MRRAFELLEDENACANKETEPKVQRVVSENLNDLEDGLYAIQYFLPAQSIETGRAALAILREGHILGSDKFGGVFEGRLFPDSDGGAEWVVLKLRVPPGGCLVTGLCVGGDGAQLELRGNLHRSRSGWRGALDVAGETVEVRFQFVGALPHEFAP